MRWSFCSRPAATCVVPCAFVSRLASGASRSSSSSALPPSQLDQPHVAPASVHRLTGACSDSPRSVLCNLVSFLVLRCSPLSPRTRRLVSTARWRNRNLSVGANPSGATGGRIALRSPDSRPRCELTAPAHDFGAGRAAIKAAMALLLRRTPELAPLSWLPHDLPLSELHLRACTHSGLLADRGMRARGPPRQRSGKQPYV